MPSDCAWCGGEIERDYPNKRGENFCSPSHRNSSNRALKRLRERMEGVSMTVCFKAELHDGTVLTGPIMGKGGMISSGVPYADMALVHRVSLDRIAAAKRCVKRSRHIRPLGIWEPKNGCIAIYPDFSAEGDGDPVAIPLLGTEFSIAKGETR